MRKTFNDTYFFYAVFLALTILYLWGIVTNRLFPFVDLPDHLAVATIRRYYADPSTLFKSFYLMDTFLKPNVFHLFFCSSSLFPSVEFANRVYLCLYAIVFPAAVLIGINYCKGNRWFALISFLFLYNFNVSWGFMGYMMAIPIFFITYVSILKYLKESSRLNALITLTLLIFLYFVHVQMAAFALCIFFATTLFFFRRSLWVGFQKLWVSLPMGCLILFWWFSNSGDKTYGGTVSFLIKYWFREYFLILYKRFNPCVNDNSFLFGFPYGDAYALLFTLPLIVMGLLYFLQYGVAGIKQALSKKTVSFALLSGVCLMCYLILPHEIPDQHYIYERFSVLWFITLIIILSVVSEHFRTVNGVRSFSMGRLLICLFILGACGGLMSFRIEMWIATLLSGALGCLWYWIKNASVRGMFFVAIVVVHGWLYNNYFQQFNEENSGFTPGFFAGLSAEETFSGIIYDIQYKSLPSYVHFPSYYVVWNRGNAMMSITDFRFATIRPRDTVEVPIYKEWAGMYPQFDLSVYDGMRYMFVRGVYPASAQQFFDGYRIIESTGMNRIYEKKL